MCMGKYVCVCVCEREREREREKEREREIQGWKSTWVEKHKSERFRRRTHQTLRWGWGGD